MTPPISIDGTDITGATIDGTDVTEITVDGQTVFSAESLPGAYSNLVAWYPFDSSFYGGSNADDVTALFNPGQSGDSTAYDGIVSGPSFSSTSGFFDINAGLNSDAFDFADSNEFIETGNDVGGVFQGSFTVMCWANYLNSGNPTVLSYNGGNGGFDKFWVIGTNNAGNINMQVDDASTKTTTNIPYTSNTDVHLCMSYDASTNAVKSYKDGNFQVTNTTGQPNVSGNEFYMGVHFDGVGGLDGIIDDVRIYNTVLSDTQIAEIYDNTDPDQNP